MHFLLTRIIAFLFLYICAGEADETQAIYIAIPLILIVTDLYLKVMTGKGIIFHLLNRTQ